MNASHSCMTINLFTRKGHEAKKGHRWPFGFPVLAVKAHTMSYLYFTKQKTKALCKSKVKRKVSFLLAHVSKRNKQNCLNLLDFPSSRLSFVGRKAICVSNVSTSNKSHKTRQNATNVYI